MAKEQVFTIVLGDSATFRCASMEEVEDKLMELDLNIDDDNVLVFPCAPLKLKRMLVIEGADPKPARKPRTPRVAQPAGDEAPKLRLKKDGTPWGKRGQSAAQSKNGTAVGFE